LTASLAAFVVWLGAALVVLADGKRGLALGTALAAAGLAVLTWVDAGPVTALLIGTGGLVAAARRLMTGVSGWGVMPPGSTPRIILSVAGGLVALWIALGVMGGSGAALRFSVLTAVGLAVARVLSSGVAEVQLSAAAVVALGIAVAATIDPSTSSLWPCLVAAVIAAGMGWLPVSARRAA
jgi:hypothetical protein